MPNHFIQFIKFSSVGFVNVIIDFTVLNLLVAATHIYGGLGIVFLNSIAWIAALTNSYFINKHWTFRHNEKVSTKEFSKFLLVNLGGVLINTAIVFLLTTLVRPVTDIHPQLWLNVAKVLALPVSALWNFLGAKFIVFQKPKSPAERGMEVPD